MLLFAQQAGFDPMRLLDYGAVGVMLLMVIYAYNASQKKLQTVYDDIISDTRKTLVAERAVRQEFETRITNILNEIVKSTTELSKQVGQKRESIDQLAHVVGDLVAIVNSIKPKAERHP